MPQPLFGRARELALLEAALDDAVAAAGSRPPQLVVVEGEAGIGKTALVSALTESAGSRGQAVRWANGAEEVGVPPYWMWRQLLDGDLDTSTDRFALFEALTAALRDAAGVLAVVDDVQWVDEPSLHALRHVLRRPVGTPLTFVVTRRTGESGEAWEKVGADLLGGSDVVRVQLHGLEHDAATACLAAAAGSPVAEEIARDAERSSGGNPLFLRELGRLLAAGSRGPARGGLADIIAARVRRLAAATQQLLHAASLLGEEWELPVVARLLDQPTAACLPAVDEGLAVGLLRDTGGGRFRFSHGLVRQNLAAQIPLQQAVTWHHRAAQAIEELNRDALSASLADIARHWAAVAVTGERGPAVDWSRRAADEAARSLAYEEAVRLYGLALECGGPSLAPPGQAEVLVARASAAAAAGRLQEAFADCRRAVALAQEHDRNDIVVSAVAATEAIGSRSRDRELRDWCTSALAATPEHDEATRGRLLARLAETCMYSGDYDDGASYAEAALRAASSSEDLQSTVAALRARQLAVSGPEHTDERRQLAARMTELGERMRDASVEMWGRLWAIDARFDLGDLAGVATEVGRLGWCVEQVGGPLPRWHLLVARAALAQARAEFDTALDVGAEAFAVMDGLGHPAGFGAYMSLLALVAHHHGSVDVPAGVGPQQQPPGGIDDLRDELFGLLGPAFALAQMGQMDTAEQMYRRAGRPQRWDIPPYFRLPAYFAGSHVAMAVGSAEDVAWFRERLEPFRGRHIAGGAGSACYQGPVELTLGACSAMLGDIPAAERDLARAAAVADDVGAAGFAVEARVRTAELLTAHGRSVEGTALARDALPAARGLGMAPWVSRLQSLAVVAEDPLTAREREVAALVGRGRSNRDIAAALVVSERTAANHVQHILTKLGFSNRAQIAAWVAGQQVRANE